MIRAAQDADELVVWTAGSAGWSVTVTEASVRGVVTSRRPMRSVAGIFHATMPR